MRFFDWNSCVLTLIVRIIIYAGSSYVNGRWSAGDEPLYYVVSPKDIVIAKPRLGLRFPSFFCRK